MHGRKIDLGTITKIKMLRAHGHSVPEISKLVLASKTSVLRYITGVQILPEYLAEWSGKRGGSRRRKLIQERQAFEDGKDLVSIPSQKEKMLYMAALYWAEGSKGDFGLSNTDPELIRIFVNGLREVYGITDDRMRISVRIYEDLDREQCLDFWSKVVGIDKAKFVNVNVLSGKKKGKLLYGMCRVRVTKGAFLLKKIIGINKAMVSTMSL